MWIVRKLGLIVNAGNDCFDPEYRQLRVLTYMQILKLKLAFLIVKYLLFDSGYIVNNLPPVTNSEDISSQGHGP